MSSLADSDSSLNETKTLRLRLVALLSLYDLLPPSFDKTAFFDFNSPPPLDDMDSMLRSLVAIAHKLHVPGVANEAPMYGMAGTGTGTGTRDRGRTTGLDFELCFV